RMSKKRSPLAAPRTATLDTIWARMTGNASATGAWGVCAPPITPSQPPPSRGRCRPVVEARSSQILNLHLPLDGGGREGGHDTRILDPPRPVVAIVFPIAAPTLPERTEVIHQHDRVQILRQLIPHRPLNPQPHRRAIAHRQDLVIQPIGEDRLR